MKTRRHWEKHREETTCVRCVKEPRDTARFTTEYTGESCDHYGPHYWHRDHYRKHTNREPPKAGQWELDSFMREYCGVYHEN